MTTSGDTCGAITGAGDAVATAGGQWLAKVLYALVGALLAGGGGLALIGQSASADTNIMERVTVVELRVASVEKAVAEIAPEVKAMREASQQMARSLDVAVRMIAVQEETLRQERGDRKEADAEIRAEIRARPVASVVGGR